MKTRHLLTATALLASACSFTPQNNGNLDASFHPPLVERHWQTQTAILQNGTKVCSISSGYNGITVYLSDLNGVKNTAVKSTRMMQPGATLTVNAGGSSFEAYDTFFPANSADELVEHLAKGGKAYMEWSEFSGPSGRERTHVQNIVPLDDFAAHLKECRHSLDK